MDLKTEYSTGLDLYELLDQLCDSQPLTAELKSARKLCGKINQLLNAKIVPVIDLSAKDLALLSGQFQVRGSGKNGTR